MIPVTRIPCLAAAGALLALTAASIPARAGEAAQNQGPVGRYESSLTDCQLLRRAISRRACLARLWRDMHIDTAENK
jgi:hypothetical protein